MRMEEDMIMDKVDIDYFLLSYLRTYKFYNQNKLPKKITVPMIPNLAIPPVEGEVGAVIPVEFVPYVEEKQVLLHEVEVDVKKSKAKSKKEKPSDSSRPKRARGHSKAPATGSPSNHNAPEQKP